MRPHARGLNELLVETILHPRKLHCSANREEAGGWEGVVEDKWRSLVVLGPGVVDEEDEEDLGAVHASTRLSRALGLVR